MGKMKGAEQPQEEAKTPEAESKALRSKAGATLHHVAQLAGVSSATASRAINQPDLVSPDTRDRVQVAIERLGYVPNLLAGGLASRRSRLVAAIVPSISTLMFARVTEAFNAKMREAGYQVLLGITDYDCTQEEELLATVLARKPDAILVTGINHTPLSRRRLLAAGIPVVETWDLTRSPIDSVVGFSHEEIGRAVGRFLLGRGYRRFALASAAEERSLIRQAGLLAVLAENGIDDVPVSMMAPPTSVGSGRASLAELLEAGERPEVIFCASDPPAQGVLIEAKARGLRVPQDLAIMGFGDLEFSACLDPPLTTVRIDPAKIGLQAAETILSRIKGKDSDRILDLGFEIQARASA